MIGPPETKSSSFPEEVTFLGQPPSTLMTSGVRDLEGQAKDNGADLGASPVRPALVARYLSLRPQAWHGGNQALSSGKALGIVHDRFVQQGHDAGFTGVSASRGARRYLLPTLAVLLVVAAVVLAMKIGVGLGIATPRPPPPAVDGGP